MMSDRIYLSINGTALPVEPKRGYSLKLDDAETVNETEAGTYKRSVYRSGVPKISVSFWCDLSMLQQMRSYRNATSVLVRFFDPSAEADSQGDRLVQEYMYVTNYSEKLLADTTDGGLWSMSFDLEDLSYV